MIVSVDGKDAADAEQVAKRIRAHDPGESTTIEVLRDGDPKTIEVVTEADPDDDSVARIGIGIRQEYRFPVKVNNNVGHQIGGPSAGAMFALAIYDKLTPGQLTGGQRIAGTGEIDGSRTVGLIGGIR